MKKKITWVFMIGVGLVCGPLGLSAAAAKAENQSAGGFVLPAGWQPRMKINEAAPEKELGLPDEALLGRKAFNLLRQGKFDELQSFLLRLQSEMEKNLSKEDRLVDAFEDSESRIPALSLFFRMDKEIPREWPALARGAPSTQIWGLSRAGQNGSTRPVRNK
ncbi:MAG: hypothetical protein IPL30_10185 [Elusimicrobia bacterium]|nr:hypothetical protein [Elusimicrobiota bacterium]